VPHDLCAIFRDQLDHLYTLALLLTADHKKAEQCFLRGLEDCLLGKPIFREWTQAWTRRAIISSAIRMVSPTAASTPQTAQSKTPKWQLKPETGSPVGAITQLEPFERFVYVISVLEGYSADECSILLGCPPAVVSDARTHALQQMADILNREPA
jgi:hypothetical protein